MRIEKETYKVSLLKPCISALKQIVYASFLIAASIKSVSADEDINTKINLPMWVSVEIPDTLNNEVPIERGSLIELSTKELVQLTSALTTTSLSQNLISDLALSLKNDPLLIYQYVYNQIEHEPTYGVLKGSLGTVLDKSGNSFDQAALLAELLNVAGYSASVLKVKIDKPDAEIYNWLNVDPSLPNAFNIMVNQLSLANGLNQLARVGSKIRFVHAIVEVNIDGQTLHLDPSFKSYVQHIPSIDIANVIGFSKTSFLNAIAPGNVVDSSALKEELSNMTNNLQQNLLTNHYDKSSNQILGSWDIVQNEQTELPNITVASVISSWTVVPTNHSATLRIQYGGINQLLESRNIYGKRLYIVFDASNRPELWLNESKLATGTTQNNGNSVAITFTVNQPYGQNYGDQSWTQYLKVGGAYSIINSWGDMGDAMTRYYQEAISEVTNQNSATETSIRTLASMGMNWLYDINIGRQFNNKLNDRHTIGVHSVGIAGTTDISGQSGSPYVDVGGGYVAQSEDAGTFVSGGMLSSAFEHGVIRNTQGLDAVSTSKLLDLASSSGMEIYQTNSSNWDSVKNQLIAYSTSQLNLMQQYINAGYTLVAPKRGDLTLDDWSGSGYFTFLSQGTQMSAGYLINGGLNGGFSSTPAPVNSDLASNIGQVVDDTWDALTSFDPINMSSGDFLFYSDDIKTGSAISALNFSRNYNSSNHGVNKGLGLGWKHNHDITARADSNIALGFGQKSAIDAAPAIVAQFIAKQMLDDLSNQMTRSVVAAASTYSWLMDQLNDNVVYISKPDDGQQYTRLADGSFLSPQGLGEELIKNSNGTFQAKSKHGLIYDFNADGQITQLTDRNNNHTSYQYNNGKLVSISNDFGRSLTLAYNTLGLASVTSDDGRSVSYEYDGDLLLKFTNTLNQSNTYQYQDDNYLEKVFTPEYPLDASVFNLYDSWGKVKEQTSSIGGLHYYHIVPNYRAEEISPQGNSYTVYFNAQGKVTKHIDADGLQIRNKYDGLNRKISVSYPEGNLELVEYDNRSNITKVTRKAKPGSFLPDIVEQSEFSNDFNQALWKEDPAGNRISYNYDSNGNLNSTTFPEVEVNGQLVEPQNTYTYQANGLLSSQIDAAGIIESYTYYNNGQLHVHKRDDGGANLITTYTYNNAGDTIGITNARNKTFTYVHDTERKLIKEVDPLGAETQYVYDNNGRQTQINRKTNDTLLYPSGYASTLFSYSKDNKILSETDAAGNVVTNNYDIQGQLLEITDPDGRKQHFTYDNKQRLIKEETLDDNTWITTAEYGYTDNGYTAWIKDANGNQTSYVYDGFDRLSTTTFADGTISTKQYFPTGALSHFTDRNGIVSTYQYDALNRVVEQQNGQEQRLLYTYTLQGQQQSIQQYLPANSTQVKTLSFEYDNLKRLIEAIDNNNQIVKYQYNQIDQVTRLTYPDNDYVDYSYDNANRNYQVKLNGAELVSYTYNSLSQLTSLYRSNGLESQYTYNKAGQRSSITHLFGSQSLGFNYQYNNSGQLTQKSFIDLANAWVPQTNQTTNYSANNLNQYSSAGAATYNYDSNGNLSQSGNIYNYEFNTLNQLIAAEPIGFNQRIEYQYDALGRRKTKDRFGQITFYLHGGNNIIAEYDSQLNLKHKIIYATGIDRPLVLIKGGQTYFYHQDEVGSVVALSDIAGNLVEKYSYSPFGQSNDISSVENPLRYTARYLDVDTHIYQYRARDYMPELGRFLQPDPIGFSDGMNIYSYVGNDPTNYVDPTGKYGEAIDSVSSFVTNASSAIIAGLAPSGEELTLMSSGVLAAGADGPLPIGDIYAVGTVLTYGSKALGRSADNVLGVISQVQRNRSAGLAAEANLRNLYGGASKSIGTSDGWRHIDNFIDGIAQESKVGRTSATSRIKRQVMKDVELRSTPGTGVTSLEWHFSRGTTGIGPTPALEALLRKNNIKIIIND